MNRRILLALLAASSLAPIGAIAQTQYPTRPIRVVVPFPPGGVVDTIGRQWAQRVGSTLGSLVVDNWQVRAVLSARAKSRALSPTATRY